MNKFDGHIAEIQTHEQLSKVTAVLEGGLRIQAMVIETPDTADYMVEGGKISVHFKETEVILCLPETSGISEPNQVQGIIVSLESGVLLTWVCLQTKIGDIGAVIPSDAVKALDLSIGKKAVACVKTTEVMLSVI
ncbi:TOBE domain-containing protein [Robiginitalea aurantiaca]|uniref:TOBE domain-containing protein n=1 Tax=Robiginitalea aurantiaca TaxID=3056915 RepID=A0ABT7WD54_9FLAO|nr:TOBE domain-containing protein [Robiginitalea aurantiaca]MDM9630838.1 TOBE domain-containing protein [Robiginitalea aurantiaca]